MARATDIFRYYLEPIDAMVPFLLLSIAIGVFHVFLGLGLEDFHAYTEMSCKRHVDKAKKHICEKTGMMIVITVSFW